MLFLRNFELCLVPVGTKVPASGEWWRAVRRVRPAPVILLSGLGRELPSWPPRMVLVLTRLGWESPSWLGGTRQAPPPRAGARAQDLNSLWLVSLEKMKGITTSLFVIELAPC